jgi:hypothetical protein
MDWVAGAEKAPDDDGKSVAYSKLIPVLIEAIKAQQAQIEDLKQAMTTQRGDRAPQLSSAAK